MSSLRLLNFHPDRIVQVRMSSNSVQSWCLLLFIAATAIGGPAQQSALWSKNGENWTPQSRLPDFSWAGYHCGGKAIPTIPPGVSVKDFGAKGDGETDDSQAFLDALAVAKPGAIEVPPGRYKITKILEITRPGLVLRGAGPDKSVLLFPIPLNEVKPNWGATTSGQRTSNYSWSGGFVWIKGTLQARALATISTEARRGDRTLTVSPASQIEVGQRIMIEESDDANNSLAAHLYSGDPGSIGKLKGSTRVEFVCRVTKVSGAQIHLDRPLRCDLKPEWKPLVRSFDPSVTEAGIENLCFEFPNVPYGGHFSELGYNAVAMQGCSDCWARNLKILNSDSGIFACGFFCTAQGIVYESARKPDASGSTGHHGFSFKNDNLFADFDFRTRFIHDITLEANAAGNVAAHGKGVDLCFDGHKRTCHDNLFTDIDAGKGTHLWRHGGGAELGKALAARCTFWNIRTRLPQSYTRADYGPASMNLVAVSTTQPSVTNATGKWFESIPPESIHPPDLHQAQLTRRLGRHEP